MRGGVEQFNLESIFGVRAVGHKAGEVERKLEQGNAGGNDEALEQLAQDGAAFGKRRLVTGDGDVAVGGPAVRGVGWIGDGEAAVEQARGGGGRGGGGGWGGAGG